MKTILVVLSLLTFSWVLPAQNNSEMWIFHLKDGSRLEGTILSENEEEIQFRLFGGYDMVVDPTEIESRVKGKAGRKYFPDGRWITLRGFYSVLNFNTTWGKNSGRTNENELLTGLKLQSIHGYKFNRYLSLGISLGIHSFEMPPLEEQNAFYYSEANDFSTFPLELDLRGFLTDKRIAPYYAVNAGYGFAIFKNEEFIERAGGISGQAEIGVRFAGRKTGSFQLGMGYLVQGVDATYTVNPYSDLRFVRVDTRLHRFVFNFGWAF